MKEFNIEDFILILALFLVIGGMSIIYMVTHPEQNQEVLKSEPIPIEVQDVAVPSVDEVDLVKESQSLVIEEPENVIISEEIETDLDKELVTEEPLLSATEEDLIAQVVMAESEGEEMIGKVAVATTILNRSEFYCKTIEEVITEPNQYAKGKPANDDCYRAVEIAVNNRDLFDRYMFWFQRDEYHKYGVPYMKIGKHCFNRLEVKATLLDDKGED